MSSDQSKAESKPPESKSAWKRFGMWALGSAGGLLILFLGAAFITPLGSTVGNALFNKTSLELVDIEPRVAERHDQGLDIKVKNTQSSVSVITRANVEVLQSWALIDLRHPFSANCRYVSGGGMPVTGVYQMLWPYAQSSDTVSIPINQQVGANEADRFDLRFNDSIASGPEYMSMLLRVHLLTDNAASDAKTIMITAPGVDGKACGLFPHPTDLNALRAHDRVSINDLRSVPDQKSQYTERVINFIRQELSQLR